MKTVQISLNSIDKVKSFVNDITRFENDFDLVSGRYVIDAKSIMGIFSLDLSKPIDLNIHAEENIDAILDIICAEKFDATQDYAIGDVVRYTDDKIYKFKAPHTANDPWDADEVDEKDVVTLIKEAEPESLTQQQLDDLIALLG